MKYNININQLALSSYEKLDLSDCAILEYLMYLDLSRNELIEENRFNGFTWVNYNKLMKDMPLLRIRSKSSLTPRIKKLEEYGFIECMSAIKSGQNRLYFKCTSKIDELEVKEAVQFDERPTKKPSSLTNATVQFDEHDNNTIDNNKDILLSKIKTTESLNKQELKAKLFFDLIKQNLIDKGQKSFIQYDKSKLSDWVKQIDLMEKNKGRCNESFNNAYKLLKSNSKNADFWKKNVRSISGIDKHFDSLLIAYNEDLTMKTEVKQKQKLVI